MGRFALRSVLARRRRAAMTVLAVLLGVSMIAGTFVFTDTIDAASRQLFTSAAKGADVVVSGRQDITSRTSAPATMPASLVQTIREMPGVAAAAGQISDVATIVGRDGRVLQSTGASTLALSYVPPPFSGITLAAGSPPRGPREVAVDEATAARAGYHVGDTIPVVTGEPVQRFRISGIARLGDVSLGGSPFAVFDFATAQRLYAKRGKTDIVYVAGASGISPDTLVAEINPLLGPELVARTGQGQVDTDVARISDRLGILTSGLLAFGLIAVLVGALLIFNTFSITVTQRMREFALLRALGATRDQVLLAVLAEAAIIGAVGSAAGLAGGLLAAAGIRALFTGVGFDLPSTSLVIAPRTVIVAVAVGVLVTVAAGLLPALRATRTPPLQALRESSAAGASSGPGSRLGALAAVVLGIAGVVAIFTSSGTTGARLERSAIGAVALVLAVVFLSPFAIRRLARVLSWPLHRGAQVVGTLARENAGRNPGRTAVSSSSLMIGLALVLFVTVYASGLRTTTSRIIHQTFLGDFTIESQDGSSPIPAASARAAAVVPDLLAISSLKTGDGRVPGAGKITAEGIDPSTIGQVYRFSWVNGAPATMANLGAGDALVERDTARAAHLHVGDGITLTSETGLRAGLTIRGVYRDKALLSGVALANQQFDQLFHQPRLREVFIKLAPGANRDAAQATLSQALGPFPGVIARSQQQLQDEIGGRVNSILVLFYALLAMSVLMSLLGIAGTLNLSIHERTRELGLLRAVGMTPRQARVLICDESVITAAIGALVGVGLGIALAWVITRAMSTEGIVFALPLVQVLAVLAVGLCAGVLAAVPPARRAARLDVLAAIAHE